MTYITTYGINMMTSERFWNTSEDFWSTFEYLLKTSDDFWRLLMTSDACWTSRRFSVRNLCFCIKKFCENPYHLRLNLSGSKSCSGILGEAADVHKRATDVLKLAADVY